MLLRKKCNNLGDPLKFHFVPSTSQTCNVSCTLDFGQNACEAHEFPVSLSLTLNLANNSMPAHQTKIVILPAQHHHVNSFNMSLLAFKAINI